ncbi:MAG: DEAD/DEAH box helicase [Candidatus Lokiarchaeota archaeon]|nr:DEAD/DEAH box helicase [Candidatus Lokiarchaeota archaeon]
MSITKTAKLSFLIIDRDSSHKRKNFFNLYVFKLLEDNPQRGVLSYNKKPIFKGLVQIERIGTSEEASIEAYKFWKRIAKPSKEEIKNPQQDLKKNLKPLDVKLFKQLIKNINFIVIPAESEEEDLKLFLELSERMQGPEIRKYFMCKSCKAQKRFTLVDKNEYFLSRNKDKICKECAGKEMYYILEKDLGIQVNSQLKLILGRLLLRYRSIPQAIAMLNPNFNPVNHPELSLWDSKSRSEALIKKYETTKPNFISRLPIANPLKHYYKTKKIDKLLPIQSIAVEKGLFRDKSLLVVSSTSSGKTLLGELSGFSRILKEGGVMIYAVPLVALANLRYEEYKELKKYGIHPFLLIGGSFVRKRKQKTRISSNTNVIVGTYEAIDAMLRSGYLQKQHDRIHTLVIDEIQMLNNTDRGYQLDGLIARLRHQYPSAQYLFLSATLSDARELANHYTSTLIEFRGRPVPLERHLILVLNEFEKQKMLMDLVVEEFKMRSSFGFRGQSLVFTNSRRKCESIAKFLNHNGISAAAYHAGLTYDERLHVEDAFQTQKISCVVTTAALAAGVDFPASQVIFESLAMGINWLTVAEFEQMCGRAGRYRKHDKAKAIILCEPGKSYNAGQLDSEEKVAISLLKGRIEKIFQDPDEDRMFTEVLAFITMKYRDRKTASLKDLQNFQKNMLNNNFSLKMCLLSLIENDFINPIPRKSYENIIPTRYGIASSSGFFTLSQCLKIRESLELGKNRFDLVEKLPENLKRSNIFVDIAIDLNPFKNFYISNALANEIKSVTGKSKTSTLLFSNQVMSLLHAETFEKKRKLPKFIKNLLLSWTQELFTCSCVDNPYCECGRKTIQEKMIHMRLNGKEMDEIKKYFMDYYQIQIFRGDLYDFFDQLIYNLRSIFEIAKTIEIHPNCVGNFDEIPAIIESLID